MKEYTAKEFHDMLIHNGFIFSRVNGSHRTYTKKGHKNIITIPYRNKGSRISKPMGERLLKEAGICV